MASRFSNLMYETVKVLEVHNKRAMTIIVPIIKYYSSYSPQKSRAMETIPYMLFGKENLLSQPVISIFQNQLMVD